MEHPEMTSPEEHIYQTAEAEVAALRAALVEGYARARDDLEAIRVEHARASASLLERMDALIARTAFAKAKALGL